MKTIIPLSFLIAIFGCTQDPWSHKGYGPDGGKPNYVIAEKDLKLSVSISATHIDGDNSGPPFKLKLTCTDKDKDSESLIIQGLLVSTQSGRILHRAEKEVIYFVVPEFKLDTEPYFSRAVYNSPDLELSHGSKEKVLVSFKYSVDEEILDKEVEVIFEEYTDEGTYKPKI